MTPSLPTALPRRASVALVLLLLASGCMGTKVSKTWSDPALKQDRYERVMVLVVAADPKRRETAEDRIYERLAGEGVQVVRSYDSLPADAIGTRERIKEAVVKSGADALLAVVVTSVDKDTEVQEGREQWVPTARGIDYYGYVNTYYGLYRTPEMYEVLTMKTETTLWDVSTQRMVWACQTESESGKETITTSELTDQYASVVLDKVRPYLKKSR